MIKLFDKRGINAWKQEHLAHSRHLNLDKFHLDETTAFQVDFNLKSHRKFSLDMADQSTNELQMKKRILD